ncbi:MAG TPA: bifunctional diaminohydroxyphosphoribosylaminopyrimidine deaminase/5-amino-6-(5-phosphoribosylamino)uracil reductase RibD [Stellaceae bacterium]|nr:bifunctional diaminohydroxyphosphoribosylaminopyrimidine deaminase/5-amino-6-(5-phosphoribosylamino)uracil reductase RibD [Stellaceae bacterium]
MDDAHFMRAALTLARRGLGAVWPNPAVGCVLVKDGAVVGRGWTQPGGRPHGETEALARAGANASGATAYVSLEPCCHHGKTPPCADALIAAGIARAVVAIEDPDPRVSGHGLTRLRAAGIAVETGLGAKEAAEINVGFLMRINRGRPLVTLKLAATLDGRIATASGESQWITGEPARQRAHLLRATHDAVMVGIGTVMADDPLLTCRLPGLEARSPVRIVVDGSLRVPLTAKLVAEAKNVPTWLIHRRGVDAVRRQTLIDCGVELIEVPASETLEMDLAAAFAALGKRGLTRVLIEGGAGLAGEVLEADLVDRLAWFHAPLLIGGDGLPAVAAFGVAALNAAPRFRRLSLETIGEDVLETLARAA